jgi:hypothetical protein
MFFSINRKISSFLFALFACFTLLPADEAKAQPAPPLTEFRVIGVLSVGHLGGSQWDEPRAGAISTPGDHRGGGLYVAVFERGYGQGSTASFNGSRMTLVQSEPLVGADRRVFGWIRYYHSPVNFTSGRFTSSSRSMNSPWNSMSTSLTIR